VRRIYFDTNAYIFLVERPSAEARLIFRLFGWREARTHVIVTSELTLAEALVHPIEIALDTGDYRKRDHYLWLIDDEPGVREVVRLERQVLQRAALVRAQCRRLANRKVKLPDAVHLASAMEADCDTFVTGDRGLLDAARDIANGVGLRADEPRSRIKHVVDLTVEDLTRLSEELDRA
jgi:predicted nucleic acid-binding protein